MRFTVSLLFHWDLPMFHESGRAALLRRPNLRDNGSAATPPYQEEVHEKSPTPNQRQLHAERKNTLPVYHWPENGGVTLLALRLAKTIGYVQFTFKPTASVASGGLSRSAWRPVFKENDHEALYRLPG
jgi:hypothetical protein